MSYATSSTIVCPNAGDNGSSQLPVGTMVNFAGYNYPAGWIGCDGAAISRTQYPALFAVIGTIYGSGDGSTTFNLPNTAGRLVRGVNATYTIGGSGGSDAATIAIANLPPHSHAVFRGGVQAVAGSGDWIGTPNVDTGFATGGTIYGATDTPSSGSRTAVVQQNGTGQTNLSLINPWVGISYIIKAI